MMDNVLTDEQKKYIKHNFDIQPLDEIAEYLQVSPTIVASFIITELASGLLEPLEETPNLDFLKDMEPSQPPKKVQYSISFELDATGDVDIHMEWPEKDNTQEFVENIGVLLYMIHSGKIKAMIGQNLTRIAQDNDMEEEVLAVIHKWNELDGLDNARPCVKPHEVF